MIGCVFSDDQSEEGLHVCGACLIITPNYLKLSIKLAPDCASRLICPVDVFDLKSDVIGSEV